MSRIAWKLDLAGWKGIERKHRAACHRTLRAMHWSRDAYALSELESALGDCVKARYSRIVGNTLTLDTDPPPCPPRRSTLP